MTTLIVWAIVIIAFIGLYFFIVHNHKNNAKKKLKIEQSEPNDTSFKIIVMDDPDTRKRKKRYARGQYGNSKRLNDETTKNG